MNNKLKDKVSEAKGRMSGVRDWLSSHVAVCMVFALAAIALSVLITMYARHQENINANIINEQLQMNDGMRNKIAAKKAANNRAVRKASQAVTGLNYLRKKQDDALAAKLLNKVCNWSNGEEYRNNRADVEKKYGISPKSSFMTAFMPVLKQRGQTLGGTNGTNEIDEDKLNMSLNSVTSYVTDISGENYSYFAIVTTVSHDKRGATANGTIAMRYTINGAGKITRLSANTIGANNNDND